MSARGSRPGGAAVAASPSPAAVPGNDWTLLEPPPAGDLELAGGISAVIEPSSGGPEAEALTAAALEAGGDRDPAVEVIAPGSERRPEGEIVVLLAAGTIPAPGHLAAHARWHQAASDAVSVAPAVEIDASGLDLEGLRSAAAARAPAELLDPLRLPGEDPFRLALDLTATLTEREGGLFLAAALGTVAVRREMLHAAGGLADPGLEPPLRRLDLVHRLACLGAVIVPEASVPAWTASGRDAAELGRAIARAAAERRTLELDHPEAAALVPLEPFRRTASARRLRRPAVVVNVEVGEAPGTEAAATIRAVLDGHSGDLELRVQVADAHPDREAIAAAAAGDPRAAIAPASTTSSCDSPYQLVVPAAALPEPRTIADLHRLLVTERAGALHVTVPGAPPDETMVEAYATAALERSRRVAATTGESAEAVLGRLFGERWVSGVEVGVRSHGVDEPHITEHGPLAAATDLDHERTQHLRFRDRADDLAGRIAEQSARIVAERLRARRERLRVERLEARLSELGTDADGSPVPPA